MVYVLVHGGGFGASCWDLLTPQLAGPVAAVDLPGRGSRPADLTGVTIADFVAAVVDEITGSKAASRRRRRSRRPRSTPGTW